MMLSALQGIATIVLYGAALAALALCVERVSSARYGELREWMWRAVLLLPLMIVAASAVSWSFSFVPTWPNASEAAQPSHSAPSIGAAQELAASRNAPVENTALPSQVDEQQTMEVQGLPPLPLEIVGTLGLAWLLSALLHLARTARRVRQQRRWLAATQVLSERTDDTWVVAAEGLLPSARLPTVRRVTGLQSPVACASNQVFVPDWCDALDVEEKRALLAHEFAHLRRKDPLWRLATEVAVALNAGLPWARLAQRRLDALAEHACDAAAVRVSGDGSALAQCLLQCIEQRAPSLNTHAIPSGVLAMAATERGVLPRIHLLLEETPMSWSELSPMWRRTILVAAFIGVFVVPAVAFTVFRLAGERFGTQIFTDGTSTTVKIDGPGQRLEVEIAAPVAFTADEQSVASIGAGGAFSIEEEKAGVERSLEIVQAASGLEYRYAIDGTAKPFDADGKAWLATNLLRLYRDVAFDVDAREARIFARGGAQAVLAEVALIKSDYVKRAYLERVAVRNGLTAADRTSVFTAVKAMNSDYEKAEVFIAMAKAPMTSDVLAAWSDAVGSVGSDYEARRAITAMLEAGPSNAAQAKSVLSLATKISSDYERRQLLESVLRSGGAEVSGAEFVAVAETLSSDYERRQALMALLASRDLDQVTSLAMLDAASRIGSDYESKELLVAVAQKMPTSTETLEAYRKAARELSTFERGQAEEALDGLIEV